MIEFLIALFALLLLSVGSFILLKGPTVFVLNDEDLSKEQALRNKIFFKRSSFIYILIALLCFVAIFIKSPLLYALLLVLATIFTAIFSTKLASIFKEQSKMK